VEFRKGKGYIKGVPNSAYKLYTNLFFSPVLAKVKHNAVSTLIHAYDPSTQEAKAEGS
jgi:hypothetical protein